MNGVPVWVEIIGGITAFITAVGLLYSKFLKPLFMFATSFVAAVPVAREMVEAFNGVEGGFAILHEIVAQVRNDSGSSILDTVQRTDRILDQINKQLTNMEQAARLVAVGTESSRELAARDREQLLDVIKQLDRLAVKLEVVITDRAQVARNLAASQHRADTHKTRDEGPGAAADAAAQSP